MNSQEIIKFIKTQEFDDFIYESYNGYPEVLGKVEIVSSKGDREGGGSYAEIVFHFKDHNVYLRVTGYYSSYHGTDWEEDWTEVFPREKTITVYE